MKWVVRGIILLGFVCFLFSFFFRGGGALDIELCVFSVFFSSVFLKIVKNI